MSDRFKHLLDFIAKFESRGNYNIVWGGIRKQHQPPKPLVEMTVREVLAWQDRIDPLYMSEAAGKYQIMEDTLRGLYFEAGVSLDDLYDENTQDTLAIALLRRRGLDDFLALKITGQKFANSLAKEWASLPVVSGPKQGRSYYAGDGLNKAHASVKDFMAAVMSIHNPIIHEDPQTPPITPISRQTGIVALVSLIAAGAALAWEQITIFFAGIFGG